MKNEALIRALVADAAPVQRLAPPGLRCAAWLALTAGVIAGAIVLGVRGELLQAGLNLRWLWLEGVCLLVLGSGSAWSAFQLSVPAPRSAASFGLPLASCLLWIALSVSRLPATAGFEPGPGLNCLLRIAGVGGVSLALGWGLQRRAALLERGWLGLFLGLAAFSLAGLAGRVLCARDGAAHLLVWHCLPILLLAGLAASAAVQRARRARGLALPPQPERAAMANGGLRAVK